MAGNVELIYCEDQLFTSYYSKWQERILVEGIHHTQKKGVAALALVGSVTYGQEDGVTAMESANASEKATIVFFRTGVGGGAIQFHVHNMDGDPMGYLGKSGDSFSIEVDPGTHQCWSRAARRNDVVLTVEAGKTYYVKGTVNMGFVLPSSGDNIFLATASGSRPFLFLHSKRFHS